MRRSSETNAGSPVEAYELIRASGSARLHLGQGGVELFGDARRVDRRALRQRHDRDDRRDVPAAAVDRGDLTIRLEPLLTRDREVLGERVARRLDRGERGDRDHEPGARHQSLVAQDPAGQRRHAASPRYTMYAYAVNIWRKHRTAYTVSSSREMAQEDAQAASRRRSRPSSRRSRPNSNSNWSSHQPSVGVGVVGDDLQHLGEVGVLGRHLLGHHGDRLGRRRRRPPRYSSCANPSARLPRACIAWWARSAEKPPSSMRPSSPS